MLLTGRRMTAEEAGRWGLVNRVVAGEELIETALALARQVCAGAPLAVAAVLEVLETTASLDVQQGLRRLRSGGLPSYEVMLRSEDAVEGPRAFAEKREPTWRGC